jgi:hypothetical protein
MFVKGFFRIGSRELVAWAGFKLWSSWSLPTEVARITGVSHQRPVMILAWSSYYCCVCLMLIDCFHHFLYCKEEFSLLPHLFVYINMESWILSLWIIHLLYMLFTNSQTPKFLEISLQQPSFITARRGYSCSRDHCWCGVVNRGTGPHSQSNCWKSFRAIRDFGKVGFLEQGKLPRTGWPGLRGLPDAFRKAEWLTQENDSSCEKVLEGTSLGKHLGPTLPSPI